MTRCSLISRSISRKKAFEEYGETLEGAAEAIWQFNKEIVDKTYDLIPAVKPQIAMYEQFGIEGLKAYKKTIDYCSPKIWWLSEILSAGTSVPLPRPMRWVIWERFRWEANVCAF